MVIKRKKVEEVEAQITAMIDMTFLLLIFFMSTAKFVLPEGAIPAFGLQEGGGGGSAASALPLNISIFKDVNGVTRMHTDAGEMATLAELNTPANPISAALTAYHKRNYLQTIRQPDGSEKEKFIEGTEVTIQCDDNVKWEAVVRVLDLARAAKIPDIRFKE